jgi:hypothetical protein
MGLYTGSAIGLNDAFLVSTNDKIKEKLLGNTRNLTHSDSSYAEGEHIYLAAASVTRRGWNQAAPSSPAHINPHSTHQQ